MLMAIDHIRDYIARSAMQFLPTDLSRTTAPIFFTRWITHFCAPVFILTAGLGAFLWMNRGQHSKSELSRYLITRGAWLIFLEITVLRGINIYGDPAPWSHQPTALFTVLSFLNTTKYPPSLEFLLMTLGPAIAAMAWLERFHFSCTDPLIVFGRVPFFYYAGHLLVAHLITITLNLARYGRTSFLLLAPPSMGSPGELFPPDYGFPLWTVYVVWVGVLLLLYPACLWFARLKQHHHNSWLTYL